MATSVSAFRKKLSRSIGPTLAVLAVTYFSYHTIHGDRGLFSWVELTAQVADAEAASGKMKADRTRWENKVALMSPRSLDLDMLGEQARYMLNVGLTQDLVIFYGK